MGDLPAERLAMFSPPFYRTAVDYFGSIEVGYGQNRTTKRYGALFIFLTTRAVHLEVATSLSTEDFLMTLRRFLALYRTPASINSDNGTNFLGAEKELLREVKTLSKETSLHNWTNKEGVTWNFQPPRAPHFGGAHESLVRSTKLALYRALDIEKKRNRYTSEEVLRTLFAEVISILNSRTLGYMSSDPKDLLTPNDLLNRPPGHLRVPFISPQDEDSAKRYSRR